MLFGEKAVELASSIKTLPMYPRSCRVVILSPLSINCERFPLTSTGVWQPLLPTPFSSVHSLTLLSLIKLFVTFDFAEQLIKSISSHFGPSFKLPRHFLLLVEDGLYLQLLLMASETNACGNFSIPLKRSSPDSSFEQQSSVDRVNLFNRKS